MTKLAIAFATTLALAMPANAQTVGDVFKFKERNSAARIGCPDLADAKEASRRLTANGRRAANSFIAGRSCVTFINRNTEWRIAKQTDGWFCLEVVDDVLSTLLTPSQLEEAERKKKASPAACIWVSLKGAS